MNFQTEPHRMCYEQVGAYITQMFGEQVYVHDDWPGFSLTSGSALVAVGVHPWSDDSAIVLVDSWVVTQVEPSVELFEFLLKTNGEVRFGGFAIDEANDINFRYAILGDTLDKDELRYAIAAVAHSADEYDDEIIRRFGGLRAADRVRT